MFFFKHKEKFYQNKKIIIPAAIALGLILLGGLFFVLRKDEKGRMPGADDPRVYEALIMIKDQTSKDPAEDARSNLKAGDVIVIFPEGHSWSSTERISYLLLKLKLKPSDAAKLTEPETREIKEIDRNLLKLKETNGDKSKQKDMGPRKETVRARAYRIKIEKLNFDIQKFWGDHTQPYLEKVFDKGMVEKK